MSAILDDYETLAQELEQAETALYLAQWRYHLSEAKRLERKLAGRQNRTEEIEVVRHSAEVKKAPTTRTRTKSVGRPRPASQRRFRTEGATTVIVRLLYENRPGLTNFEMQARNGIAIKGRVIRKIVNRLIAAGCAERQGKKAVITETRIAAWEASPLFLHSSRNNRGHAA
jgi:hypothetical protein